MDISQWLRETELPPQPQSFTEKDKIPVFVPPEGDIARRPAKRRRKHGRYRSSDSSILEAAFPVHGSGGGMDNVPHRSSSSNGTSDTQSTTSKELSLQHSEPETASDKYERKPRRKTRPNRYQLKPTKEKKSKEHKGQTGRHGHEERKSKKRKRKRTARDNPASGWVMGFHAKNVAKDRLTLKGPTNLGLFKKGRASSPVRGRGLPDLVFSEMRFLQKKPDQLQEPNTEQVTKKKRGKTTKAADQDEISAYFAPKRPALAERDNNVQAQARAPVKPRCLVVDDDLHQHHTRSNAVVHPSVELPKKAFLGFGTRGARPATSTSYYSWAQTSERLSSHDRNIQQPSASHEDHGTSSFAAPRRHSSIHDRSTVPPDSARSNLRPACHALPFPREMTTIDVGQLVVPPARIMRLRTNQNHSAQSKCDSRGSHNILLRDGSRQGCDASQHMQTEKKQPPPARSPTGQMQEHQSVPGETVQRGSSNAPNAPDVGIKSSSPLTKLLKACATTLNASAVEVSQPRQPRLEQPTFRQPSAQSFRAEQDVLHAPIETCMPEDFMGGRFDPGFEAYGDHQLPMESEGPRYIDPEHFSTMNSHGDIHREPVMAQDTDEYDMDMYGDGEYAGQWELQNEDMVTQEAAAVLQDQVPYDSYAYDEAEEVDTDHSIFAHFWRPNKLY